MNSMNVLEQNKAIVRRAIEEGWNPANLAVIDELYAADFIFHQESGDAVRGLDYFKTWIATIHSAFPDIRYRIEAMYAAQENGRTIPVVPRMDRPPMTPKRPFRVFCASSAPFSTPMVTSKP